MKILVCNVGSTSLKFKLYNMPNETVLCRGKAERVGSTDDALFLYENVITGQKDECFRQYIPEYHIGIEMFLSRMLSKEIGVLRSISEIDRVGFKTVLAKGYYGVHELTDDVLHAMEEMLIIAPAHNGPYLVAIRTMRELLPKTLFVGVFETAFHRTIPLERRLYGVPYEWYEKYDVRRYGYHGASHGYIAQILSAERERFKAISCHLGGSSSLCAILDGKSMDSSFGMTIQTGPIHGARVGDMDCDLLPYLKKCGLNEEEIQNGMTKNGGIKGISGVSADLRYVEAAAAEGNVRAKLALNTYANGIVHYIGAFYAELGGLDVLVFTGGVGEKSHVVRKLVCRQLRHMDIWLSKEKNLGMKDGCISEEGSPVEIRVIPTDEELRVARATYGM